MRLGQLLIDAKLLRPTQLDEALAEQRRTGGKLGDLLVRMNFVTERQVSLMLASQQGLGAVDLETVNEVDRALLQRFSTRDAHALKVVPLELLENGRLLVVATADVPRGARLESMRELAGAWIVPRLATKTGIAAALERFYGPAPVEPSSSQPTTSAEVKALIDLLAERGLLSWDEYLSRLTKREP